MGHATKEYDYDLPDGFDEDAADYVSDNVHWLAYTGKPWVPDAYCIPDAVEAALVGLCGRAVQIGDDGSSGWLLPCREVER